MNVTLRAFWRSLRSLQGARAGALPISRPMGAAGAPLPPCALAFATLRRCRTTLRSVCLPRAAAARMRVVSARGCTGACVHTLLFSTAPRPPLMEGAQVPVQAGTVRTKQKRATPRGGHPLACHRCYFVQPKQRSMDAENTASGGYTVSRYTCKIIVSRYAALCQECSQKVHIL